MSIPKEPRQLMINLMYLVLTALLALNVSAEIMQAFFSMEESLKGSNGLVEQSNQQLFAAIEEQATAYTQFEPIRNNAVQVQGITTKFCGYVDSLRTLLVEEAGGLGDDGLPKRKRDKDASTRLFVKNALGQELFQHIVATRAALLQYVEEDSMKAIIAQQLPLYLDEEQVDDPKGWAETTFNQMPVAAIMPVFRKFQNDAWLSESVVLSYLLEKVGSVFYKPDSFTPVVAAEQSYIIKNEPFRAELFLASYSSTANNIKVMVDGRPLTVENGKALFTVTPSSLGSKQHRMIMELADPTTGEIKRFEKSFTYEVGERAVTVAADKMNVLYAGVENPISIAAAGIPSAQIQVSAIGVELQRLGGAKYIAVPKRVGAATITVAGGGLVPQQFNYRVKRIPDPVMKLGKHVSKTLPAATFRAQLGLIPDLPGFDFDAKCRVGSYEVTRVPRNSDVQSNTNEGPTLSGRAKTIVGQAKAGDIYYFDKIKVRCPGDDNSRALNALVFKIR